MCKPMNYAHLYFFLFFLFFYFFFFSFFLFFSFFFFFLFSFFFFFLFFFLVVEECIMWDDGGWCSQEYVLLKPLG